MSGFWGRRKHDREQLEATLDALPTGRGTAIGAAILRSIDAIAGQPFGSLLVSVPSRAPESDAVLGALKSLGLKAEVIGHVS